MKPYQYYQLLPKPPVFSTKTGGFDIFKSLFFVYSGANLIHIPRSMDDDKVKQDFHELYELMNGMPLREMDQIVYPVCTLCRDHERSGFIHGVQVGMRLAQELTE